MQPCSLMKVGFGVAAYSKSPRKLALRGTVTKILGISSYQLTQQAEGILGFIRRHYCYERSGVVLEASSSIYGPSNIKYDNSETSRRHSFNVKGLFLANQNKHSIYTRCCLSDSPNMIIYQTTISSYFGLKHNVVHSMLTLVWYAI